MKETAQKGTTEEQTEVGRNGGCREEPIIQEARNKVQSKEVSTERTNDGK